MPPLHPRRNCRLVAHVTGLSSTMEDRRNRFDYATPPQIVVSSERFNTVKIPQLRAESF